MDDDQVIALMRRFGEDTPRLRALSVDAQRRVEVRMDAAFEAARSVDQVADAEVYDLAEFSPERKDSGPRRRWMAGTAAAAAAVIVLVVALVVLPRTEPDAPADQPAQPVPVALLEPGTRWVLETDVDASTGDGSIASLTLAVGDDLASPTAEERVVGAQARVSTSDAPPLQYLGSVTFVVEPSGSVRVPLVMLDPERDWVDCDATVDLSVVGTATCAATTIDYRPVDTVTDTVETPVGRFEATGAVVDWSEDGLAPTRRTTVWSAPAVGPVRITVDDELARTYDLITIDRPDPVTNGE